jgi:hypothetical protein
VDEEMGAWALRRGVAGERLSGAVTTWVRGTASTAALVRGSAL